jgi:galactose-1-phosphate uridylyltransferase
MSVETRRQEAERDREHQMEQTAASSAMQSAGPATEAFDAEKAEYLETLVEHEIDTGTIQTIDNLLSRDFVLGNLQRKDFEEMKWLARDEVERVLLEYPAAESAMTGWRRGAAFDDRADQKQPLTAETRSMITTTTMSFISRLSRSINAEQLEHFERTTSRVETVKSDDEGDSIFDGGLL